ncbi:cadherin-like domain-containing protein [Microcoleus sp. T2B6]|uniref:Ig-like domain-containing protein n=1 Tax=Microcoleus sp. T2B6 TaxID=3055424 RepID=UPI002FD13B9E
MSNLIVNQTTDNGLGDTTGTLSWAILQANQLAGDDTITLNNDVRIAGVMKTLVNSNINIVGNNHSISGDANNNGITDSGDVRSLFILSGNVNISDLTITNGRAEGGSSGTGGGGGGLGGGLFLYDGNVSLTNVAFTNNIAQGGNSGVGTGTGGGGMFGNASSGGGGLFGNASSGEGGYGGNGNYGGYGGAFPSNNGGFGGGGGSGGFSENGTGGIEFNGKGGRGGFGGGGGGSDNGGYYGGGGDSGFGGGGGFGDIGGSGGRGGYGGGYAGDGGDGLGGGIFVRTGSLTLKNTTFTGNTATGGTGANSGEGLGGAIFIMESTTNTNGNNQGMPTTLGIVNFTGSSSFSGNSAANDAGTATNNDDVYGTQLPATPTNQAPVANADTVSATQNTALNISVATLLANDTDSNNDPLSITGVSNLTGGTAVLNNNSTPSNSADDFITFTPTTGFSGNASFNYSISDGKGGTATALVNVAVAPVVGAVQNGTGGNDTLTGNAGNDSINGSNGDDTLTGNAGNDSLIGGNGSDLLVGSAGNDLLDGGNGTDTLRGGLGNDILTGGNGSDVFVFAALEGTDTITDFKLGNDKIGLTGGLTFGQLSFSGSEIRLGTEVLAVLTGVNTNTLTASNFLAV